MPRFIFKALLLLFAIPAIAATAPTSDPFAVTLAQQSATALTGGASVTDVTLNANVISILGSDSDNGTATLEGKGTSESRVDLSLGNGNRSDVRNLTNGTPGGGWDKNGGTSTAYAQHNCWTDAAWFFPALSSLTQTANPNFIFKYIGQEQHGGVNAQHIRVFQVGSPQIQSLSTMDFYLDVNSSLPLAVAFQARTDNDINTEIPTEIRFANYRTVSGIQVPFHFQRIFNGNLSVDFSVTNALINTGLSDAVFTLQ